MRKIFLLTVTTLLIFACKDKEPTSTNCDRSIIVSDRNFDKAKDDKGLRINGVDITGDCMTITYSYGGGCKDIETVLVAAEQGIQNTMELPFREVKLSIDDDDNCEALVTTSEEFDISALQGEGNSIILKLDKWDEDIIYEY